MTSKNKLQERGRWTRRGTLGSSFPTKITNNYQIIPNNPELSLQIGRTNFTSRGKEVGTSNKVGSVETQCEKQIDHGHCGGKVATVAEKGKTQTSTQGSTGGKQISIAIGLESERGNQ